MMNLAIPLSISQVEAANRLHRQLPQWQVTDHALHALQVRFPEFDAESTLLKVVAVNQLYDTNVYAVIRMAHHIAEVMPKVVCAVRHNFRKAQKSAATLGKNLKRDLKNPH
jgi:hypothetical protein